MRGGLQHRVFCWKDEKEGRSRWRWKKKEKVGEDCVMKIMKLFWNIILINFLHILKRNSFLFHSKMGIVFGVFIIFYERYMEQQERLQVEVGVQVEVAVVRPVPRRVVRNYGILNLIVGDWIWFISRKITREAFTVFEFANYTELGEVQ